MLTKLDAILLVACLASGALALEGRGRLDISPDNRKVTLAQMVCQPVTHSDLPVPNAIDIALQAPRDLTLVDFAFDCQPA